MRHARRDYDGIQDQTGTTTIGDDEPVFLLRAQDLLAPHLVGYWAQLLEEHGGDSETVRAVRAWATEMMRWQTEHGAKVPDAPSEQLAGGR